MEGKEVTSSGGVTVVGADAPADFHVAARRENPSHVGATASPTSVGLIFPETTMKRKRGRPRKYGPDGTASSPLSPMPISASAPPITELAGEKRGRGRPPGSLNKQHRKMRMENLGEWVAFTDGADFMPHVIIVAAGEDVTMKIISFSQQEYRAICILSANGAISNVTLRQPDSSGGTLTYEGRFEILSLSGSFMPTDNGGTRGRSGGMSVALASPDGRVVGGGVAGLLVAATPVQVVLGSFLIGNQQEQKPKKQKTPSTSAAALTAAIPISASEIEGQNGQGERSLTNPKSNLAASPSFHEGNWASMHSMQGSRKLATDINVSLSEG